MKVVYQQEFAASREAIWPYLEEPDKIKQWMEGVVDDRQTSEGPVGVGSTFEMDIKEGRRVVTYQGKITAYEKHHLMGLEMVGGCGKTPMTMHVQYRLHDAGTGRTRIDYECTVEAKGFLMKLMAPLFKIMSRSMLKKFFRNLANLVESKPAAAGA